MTITTQRLTCQACKHVFDAELVADCPIEVAIASMKAVRCPECGSSKCGIGGKYDDAPPVTAPILERIAWWRNRGEHGTSSETIYSAFTGTGRYALRFPAVPRDPDDFRRCKQLLDLLPEWRANLGKVSARYPFFAPMIEKWDEIERLYLEEIESGLAPKCYAFMRPLVEAAEKLRYL